MIRPIGPNGTPGAYKPESEPLKPREDTKKFQDKREKDIKEIDEENSAPSVKDKDFPDKDKTVIPDWDKDHIDDKDKGLLQ